MNLQHCLAAGPRIRLELAPAVEIYTQKSVRSFERFSYGVGQLEQQSIRLLVLDDVCLLRQVRCANGPVAERGKPCLAWDTAPKKRAATAPM